MRYDAAWPERYAQLARTLRASLGVQWHLEHVGSTSVPGLVAKPVIDIAVRLPAEVPVAKARGPLVRAGWTAPVLVGDHWATFLLEGTVRRAIGHLFTAEQWPEAHLRLFAEWLRRHPSDRDEYAALKAQLVQRGVWGKDYTSGKGALVQDIVNRARAEQGLAPITL